MVTGSEGGIEIGTTFCVLGDPRIADALADACVSAGLSVQISRRSDGARVIIDYDEEHRGQAENLVRVYRRIDDAGEEWRVLDLIMHDQGNPGADR